MFKHTDLQMFGLKLKNFGNMHAFEVAGRGSVTQLQVAEKVNKITEQEKG